MRFTSWRNGAQWENSASAAMGLAHFGSLYPNASKELAAVVTRRLNASRAALRGLLAAYGFVPASILGGNINAWIKNDHAAEYPGGSDTGIGWTYLRYPHVASSVWTGLLLLHQADDDETLDPHANPFAPPEGKIASAAEAATSQQVHKAGQPGDSRRPAAAAARRRQQQVEAALLGAQPAEHDSRSDADGSGVVLASPPCSVVPRYTAHMPPPSPRAG